MYYPLIWFLLQQGRASRTARETTLSCHSQTADHLSAKASQQSEIILQRLITFEKGSGEVVQSGFLYQHRHSFAGARTKNQWQIDSSRVHETANRLKLPSIIAVLEEEESAAKSNDSSAQETHQKEGASVASQQARTPHQENGVVEALREHLDDKEEQIARISADKGEQIRKLEEERKRLQDEVRKLNEDLREEIGSKTHSEETVFALNRAFRLIAQTANRDIRRVRTGKLRPQDIKPLPIPSKDRPGEFEDPIDTREEAETASNSTPIIIEQPLDEDLESEKWEKLRQLKEDVDRLKPRFYEITWFREKSKRYKQILKQYNKLKNELQ